VGKKTEKSLAARVAAVGMKSQDAFREEKAVVFNPLARNSLEIEVSTLRAVGETSEGDRHAMSVETALASMATPGLKSCEGKEKVHNTTAMRAIAVRASALRTNHRTKHLPRRAKYIQNACDWQ